MSSKSSIRQYINNLPFNPLVNDDANENLFKLEFAEPDKRLKEEIRYKFLKVESDLFFFVIDCQRKLKHAGFRFENKFPPFVEILKQSDNLGGIELFLKRVKLLEGVKIDISKPESYKMIGGKRLVLLLPKVNDLDMAEPHITIVHVNHLCNKERFLQIILNQEYSTETTWE